VRLTRGPGVFTTPENASADCKLDTRCLASFFSARSAEQERGSLLPTAPTAIEPLTPLSPLPLPPECGAPSRYRLASSSSELLLSRVRKPPRLPRPPPRERRWPVTTRGAFHRQGLFVGSGGLYSPGPATISPLLARETTAGRRSHVILSLGRSFTDAAPKGGPTKADTPAVFSSRRSLALSCPRPHRLGPRSLPPPLFLECCVRAYSGPGPCLPTSATKHDVRTPTGAPVSSQGGRP